MTIGIASVKILRENNISGIIMPKMFYNLDIRAQSNFFSIIDAAIGITSVKIVTNKYIFGINYAKKVV